MRIFKAGVGVDSKAFSTALVLWLGWACSASSSVKVTTHGNSNSRSGDHGGAGAGSNGTGSSGTNSSSSGTGSQPTAAYSDATATSGGSDSEDAEVVECTDGEDCVCPKVSVAVIGKAGKWGASSNSNGEDSDTAFQDWLNSNSAGTAKVDNHTTKPKLTPDFLASYDVIILAGLGDDSNTGPWWKFEAAEVSAFEDWIKNKGGGVIALSGYAGDGNEVDAKNALLAFSGISYNKDGLSPQCALVSTNNSQMCWCDGSEPIIEWNKTDSFITNLSNSVTMVGMQNGRSINAPTDAHVAATVTNGMAYKVLVGKAVGNGRVFDPTRRDRRCDPTRPTLRLKCILVVYCGTNALLGDVVPTGLVAPNNRACEWLEWSPMGFCPALNGRRP
jgi:hypothetical protein